MPLQAQREPPRVEDLASAVRSVIGVELGPPPDPGVQPPPYRWEDVLEGDPPPPRPPARHAYVVYHHTANDAELRFTYATIVEPEDRGLRVESRLTLQQRTALELMGRVRRRADALAAARRASFQRHLARQRARVDALPARLRPAATRALRAEARLGHALIEGARRAQRRVVELPDLLASNLLRTQAHLGDRLGRRALLRGLADPGALTTEQRIVAAFLTLLGLALAVGLLNTVVALAAPELAGPYRAFLGNAALQLLSVFAIPVILEPVFALSTLQWGAGLTFASFLAGKALGVWLLYLLGESVHRAAKRRAKGRGQRLLAWLERHAQRYGFYILIPINAVPFGPEQAVFVLAASGMSFRAFFLGNVLGSVLKYGAIIALTLASAG